jgi:hypothetical protein
MAKPTLTPGGMAMDAQGNPADMPRAMAHKINGKLIAVAAMLDAALMLCPSHGANGDEDGIHDDSSRLVSLVHNASKKVRKIIRKDLAPYV